MHLKLKDNNVDELFITRTQEENELVNRINFTYSSHTLSESDTEFCLKFDFTLTSDRGFKFKLIQDFIFECDEPLDENFWNGHFHKINAPAIAYPYLRAFVSTVLLNAGLEAVNLPSVNFVEMAKKMDTANAQ
ncbi:protein-export chaperone SecB [Kosakonia cowanii]|uniref:protein-export chaperone SecB n=1 Tax=Kosakonia cowanii TaxID=208223 RepID=UPI00272FC977|nr:protein-export chaperone SecB [Kosakonia cowanii]WKW43367.1 protein-export chaperone SecB [Kosakonia cowanii]WKW43419.1 protein-export chaperone SecB [Kosakonia cowanii]